MKKRSHWPISVLSSISAIINALLPLILVRILAPGDVGLFKIFFLYVMMIPSFSMTSGLTSGLAYWAGRGEEGRAAIRQSGFFTLVASTLFFVLAISLEPAITGHFDWPAKYSVIFAFAIFGAISTFFFEEAAIASGKIWTGAFFHSGFEMTRSLVILTTAILTHNLETILLAHTCMILLKAAAGYSLGAKLGLFGFKIDRQIFKAMWRYSFPVSLAWMFGVFINSGDQFVLSNFISPAEFALYTMGCLVVPPILIIEQSVTRVMIPQLSEAFAHGENSRAAKLYRSGVEQMSFLFIPAVTGLLVFADPIIRLLFTEQYAGAASILRVFAVSYLLLVIPYDAIPRARAQGGWILRNFMFFSLMSLSLCFALTKSFGAFGALGGILTVRACMKAYSIWYVRSSTGWKLSEFLPIGPFARGLLICGALGAGAHFARPVFSDDLIWFIVAGSVFSFSYFALILPWNNIAGLADRMESSDDAKGHVLMVAQYLGIGGLEKMILSLTQELQSTGRWRVSVFAYDQIDLEVDSNYANLIRDFRDEGCRVVSYKKKGGFSLKAVIILVREIYRGQVHVLHSHDLGSLIYAVLGKVLSLWRVRLVHTQHSFVHINKKQRYKTYERIFTAFVDELTVVTDSAVAPYVDLGLPLARVHVVQNGVAFPDEPVEDRNEKISIRKELIAGFSRDTQSVLSAGLEDTWIIYLARIHPVKGQVHAVSLWKRLPADIRKKAMLVIIGPIAEIEAGENLKRAISEAPDHERIVMPGSTREPSRWIRAADGYLSCSEFEGMPLGPLEAMGSGTPVLVSRIPGHAFLGASAPSFGLDDLDAGARAFQKVIEEAMSADYRAMWNQASWVRSTFSLEAMATRYSKLYLPPSKRGLDRFAPVTPKEEVIHYG